MSILIDMEKNLGDFHLKVNLEAGDETLALLGASGCGKSMTLKCIAGIERPDRGRIIVDDVVLFDSEKHINLSAQERRTGLMFQNYALFPNMTVKQNILAGTRRAGKERSGKAEGKTARIKRTEEIMDRFGLTGLANHLPSQISGGQQQRTALARILVSDPRILLLDEPFSALDSHLRFRMEQEVRDVIRDFGKTVVLVSHDRDEVFRLSDKIAVMYEGNVEAFDEKTKVFADPKTRNACILTGCKNISPIRKIDDYHFYAQDWQLSLTSGKKVEDARFVGLRQHDTNRGTQGAVFGSTDSRTQTSAAEENRFLCDVVEIMENPFSYTIMLRLAGHPDADTFNWEIDKSQWNSMDAKTAREGKQIEIQIPAEGLLLLQE